MRGARPVGLTLLVVLAGAGCTGGSPGEEPGEPEACPAPSDDITLAEIDTLCCDYPDDNTAEPPLRQAYDRAVDQGALACETDADCHLVCTGWACECSLWFFYDHCAVTNTAWQERVERMTERFLEDEACAPMRERHTGCDGNYTFEPRCAAGTCVVDQSESCLEPF